MWIATLSSPNRLQLCCKLVQAVVGEGIAAQDVLVDMGTDGLKEED